MTSLKKILLPYGKSKLPLIMKSELANWEILKPEECIEMHPYSENIKKSLLNPINSKPLSELVKKGEKVVIVTSDGTRPVPHKDLIPAIVSELDIPHKDITIIIGTGSHRGNTPEELEKMLGKKILSQIRVINHDSFDDNMNVKIGDTATGGPLYLNKYYVEADKRIVVGFIEPHGFAGFSGGPKGIVPGVSGIETIKYIHSYQMINSPLRGWAKTVNNPIREEIFEMAEMCPPDFLVNVTLNKEKRITNIFSGNFKTAHKNGCSYVFNNSMIHVNKRYDVVIVTNNGYPLDQNLYQSVKGLMAADQIIKDRGVVIIFTECSDGIPKHGNFDKLVRNKTSEQILHDLQNNSGTEADQWEAQVWAEVIPTNREVYAYSSLSIQDTKSFQLIPLRDYQKEIEIILAHYNLPDVAVLPEGPVAIPILD